MLWKILGWAVFSWGCGWWLNYLFEPIETYHVRLLYGLPFFFFGFLYHRRLRGSNSWLGTRAFVSPQAEYQRLTFWGVPISHEKQICEETALGGESLLPVTVSIFLTPRRVRGRKPLSVKEAYRRFTEQDIKNIEQQIVAQTRGSQFLRQAFGAGKEGGKFMYTFLSALWFQLKLATKLFIAAMMFALFCAAGVWYFLPSEQQIRQITDHVQLKLRKSGENIAFIDAVNDLYIPLENIPAHLRHALVFREDRRFYIHWGIDPRGIGRALYQQGRSLYQRYVLRQKTDSSKQGGSTITQQLAKNLFLSNERSWRRKFKEMILALKLEWHYEKETILEMYLNKIFLGPRRGYYGIEVASRAYFRKSARDLNLYESALLIQSVPNPDRYNFKVNKREAGRRAEKFLRTLEKQGKFLQGNEEVEFTSKQIVSALKQGIVYGARPLKSREIRYFLDWIRPQIKDEEYFETIQGEFTVVTTLNAEMQVYAGEAINTVLTDEVRRDRRVSEVALVALAPDGAVRAIMGGRDYGRNQYRRATLAKRQPGSTFKLFVYLAALEKGWKPDSEIDDLPIAIGDHSISNFDGKYLGRISLLRALARSRNPAAVRLIQHERIGVETVIKVAQRLGIRSELTDNPGLALGISEVTLLELTGAYTVIANGGFKVEPYGVIGVRTKNGNIRYWHTPERQRIIAKNDVNDMRYLLRAAVTDKQGTGREAQFGEYDIAGKTGTTDEYKDAWFVGFSSHLCTGVWVGNDDNTPMNRVSGGKIPTDIFRAFMQRTHEYMRF